MQLPNAVLSAGNRADLLACLAELLGMMPLDDERVLRLLRAKDRLRPELCRTLLSFAGASALRVEAIDFGAADCIFPFGPFEAIQAAEVGWLRGVPPGVKVQELDPNGIYWLNTLWVALTEVSRLVNTVEPPGPDTRYALVWVPDGYATFDSPGRRIMEQGLFQPASLSELLSFMRYSAPDWSSGSHALAAYGTALQIGVDGVYHPIIGKARPDLPFSLDFLGNGASSPGALPVLCRVSHPE